MYCNHVCRDATLQEAAIPSGLPSYVQSTGKDEHAAALEFILLSWIFLPNAQLEPAVCWRHLVVRPEQVAMDNITVGLVITERQADMEQGM